MANVFFTKDMSVQGLQRAYNALGATLPGKVAVKLHSGEPGNQNFIRPHFWGPLIQQVKGTIVECNTAYPGKRATNADHWAAMELHGWTDVASVDLMDEDGEDLVLSVPNGKQIKENFVGNHLSRYDSMLVLSHFKGHTSGGFGGALKNISIGIASAAGKLHIHSGGDASKGWTSAEEQDLFLAAMADAAASVTAYFGDKIVFVNVMANMSIDCDCNANAVAPEIADMGILASTDPVALDQACLDLIDQLDDPKKASLIERIESRHGRYTVEVAEENGAGSRSYTLVNLD